MSALEVRVEHLFTYPLKSGRAVESGEAFITASGFRDDRRFALANEDHDFVSLRSCPVLVHLGCTYRDGGWLLSWDGEPGPVVRARPGGPERLDFKIWGDVVSVQCVSQEVDRWLSSKAQRPLRLVAFDRDSTRWVDPQYAPKETPTMLADGFPVLLTTMESHQALNRWVGEPLEIGRMRPNLVVSGGTPFEEDSWIRLEGAEVTIELVKPCARCVATTVNPKTGQKGAEPLRSLAVHRKVDNEVIFGQNAIVLREGIVRVGEVLTIVTRR